METIKNELNEAYRLLKKFTDDKSNINAIESAAALMKDSIKNGGKILLSEAFYEPLVLLNSMRRLVSLDPLYEHDFNKYIKKKKLEKFLEQNQYPFECKEISSVYYLGSRFLRELITDYNSSS